MPRGRPKGPIKIYLGDDGVYRTSLGNRVPKGNVDDPKKYEVVAEGLHRAHREEQARKKAEYLERAKAAREAPAPRAAPKAKRPTGIRTETNYLRAEIAKQYVSGGLSAWDIPDRNTVRMMVKLRRLDPRYIDHFNELVTRVRAHYWRYNPVSHAIELYSHRQVYKGSYQLPEVLRSKKVNGPIQAYERRLYREGPTKTYASNPEDAAARTIKNPLVRPPGGRIRRGEWEPS